MAIKFNRSQTFATGGTVTAASLHNLIDGTDIYPALITDQSDLSTVSTADKLLIADTDDSVNAKSTTVFNLFDDALSGGTYSNAYISGQFSYGTATGTRLVSTNATITTGTIPTATLGTTTGTAATFTTGTLTTGVIPTGTFGTTTSTAATITNGTIPTLTVGTSTSTAGTVTTFNSTTGTITNLSTTLAGDFTISQGTGTVGTRVAVVNTAQEYTRAHNFNSTTLTSGTSIAWNLEENQVARLSLTTNGTIADPSNKVDGATYILSVTQGTGTNTLNWDASYKWPGGTAPTLTAGSGKTDIFTFVSNGTSLFGVASQNYS